MSRSGGIGDRINGHGEAERGAIATLSPWVWPVAVVVVALVRVALRVRAPSFAFLNDMDRTKTQGGSER
jgi:hypothetical protein